MRNALTTQFAVAAIALGGSASIALAGCGIGPQAAAPTATPAPTSTSLPTPTATAAFVVGVGTSGPVTPHPTATATPTRFVVPPGAYISLSATSGPVIGRVLIVRAGHLPTQQQVAIVWTAGGHGTGISTTTYSDKSGSLTQRFSAPSAQPGTYRISILVSGVTYASSVYRVVSAATVHVVVVPDSKGDHFTISGSRYFSHAHLLIAAYRFAKRARPVVLGRARATAGGTLLYQTTRRLTPGEYTLHVFSTDALTADLASTYFQVEV